MKNKTEKRTKFLVDGKAPRESLLAGRSPTLALLRLAKYFKVARKREFGEGGQEHVKDDLEIGAGTAEPKLSHE